jgi:hypothetical protein
VIESKREAFPPTSGPLLQGNLGIFLEENKCLVLFKENDHCFFGVETSKKAVKEKDSFYSSIYQNRNMEKGKRFLIM